MENKQRLFIYGRKEVGILFILGITVAIFAFTLGVHLGKKVGLKIPSVSPSDSATLPTQGDKNPSNQELAEQQKGVQQAGDESLNQALHDEVARRGIKLDTQRQVELPTEEKSDGKLNGKAKSGEGKSAEKAAKVEEAPVAVPAEGLPEKITEPVHPSKKSEALAGKFTIQVGSHPNALEAKAQVDLLEKKGVQASVEEAEVKGKGTRYRVYVGRFSTREQAEKAGQNYRSQNMFDSYIVAKLSK